MKKRPFKIPLKISGLIVMFLLSFLIYAIGLSGAFSQSAKTFLPALMAVLALLSAEIFWRIVVKVHAGAASEQ